MDDGKLSDLEGLSRFMHARSDKNRSCLLTEAEGQEEKPGRAAAWQEARLDPLKRPAEGIKAAIPVPKPRRPTGGFETPVAMASPTGKRDQKALRTAAGPDLTASPQDDPNATPAAICPVGGFDRHSPIIRDFAQQSKENFALVAMFAPLSAMTPMHFHVVHFPIVAYLLQTYFPVGKVSAEEIGGMVTWLTDHLFHPTAKPVPRPPDERHVSDAGWKLTASVNGAKYAAIADIWNRRQQLYDQYMAALEQIQHATGRTTAAEPGEGEESLGQDARGRVFDILDRLFQSYSGIPGTGSAKAGFMVQLLTGGLGCIDVHNRQIYQRLAEHLVRAGRRGEGLRLKGYLERLQRLTKEEYRDAVSIISTNGFGGRELWNTWVDFAASLWDVIAEKDPIYAKIDRVLRASDFPWHLFKGMRVSKVVPPGNEPWNTLGPGGKPLKQGQTFELPPVSGTLSGDALSSLHLSPVVSGGLADDPATWRRVQALMARNFDPSGSMARFAQEMPFRYVGAAQAMPSLARLRRYYLDRRRQREAEAQARQARKAQRDAALRGESLALDFRGWLRLQEAKAEWRAPSCDRPRASQRANALPHQALLPCGWPGGSVVLEHRPAMPRSDQETRPLRLRCRPSTNTPSRMTTTR
jgi:hypothetical protein